MDSPLVRVSPDIYLLDDPPPRPFPDTWQTWLSGHRPPRFAVEIVLTDGWKNRDWKRDYQELPLKYEQLGTCELIIFDPAAALDPDLIERRPLQVYRRSADGALVKVYAGPGPVQSAELDALLSVRREAEVVRLRIAKTRSS